MIEVLVARAPYFLCVALWMAAIYLLVAYRNLMKVLIGLSLFQSGVILFYVMLGVRRGGTIPIQTPGDGIHLHNPLPHALMLTAIVVGVATLGVAVAIVLRIRREEGSIDDEAADKEHP